MMEVAEYRSVPRSVLPGLTHPKNHTRQRRQTTPGTCQGKFFFQVLIAFHFFSVNCTLLLLKTFTVLPN